MSISATNLFAEDYFTCRIMLAQNRLHLSRHHAHLPRHLMLSDNVAEDFWRDVGE